MSHNHRFFSVALSSYEPATTIKAALPLGVPQKIRGFGVCETRLDLANEQIVELYCFPATDSSNCVVASVLDAAGASVGIKMFDDVQAVDPQYECFD